MSRRISASVARGLGAIVIAVVLAAPALGQPLPSAPPESLGFSPERLARLHDRMQQLVTDGKHAGIVSLVARNGRIVDWRSWGLRDLEQELPLERDTIFRIYSMTKIITSVAVMILHEEARLKLDDPIGKYLPALAKPKVMTGGTAKAPTLVAAKGPVTIKHLLTHTSGYQYGFGKAPIDEIYNNSKWPSVADLAGFVQLAAKLPLAHHPGERFTYGINTDLLGAIVEQVSGQPFAEFVRERITGPLGMPDTAFTVPAQKRARLAKLYQTGKSGGLEEVKAEGTPYPDEDGRIFVSGGGGLFSTIGDYARFAQMLLNGGELEGVRILGRKTVELMMANHLAHLPTPTTNGYDGFGLGGSVRVDLEQGNRLGSVGQFGWAGYATTYVNIDPQEGTLALVFTQHLPFNEHDLFWQFSTLMYQALVDPPDLPSAPRTTSARPSP